MAPTSVHTKLLTQAARDVLRPMGLTQRGRSRSWIDDHGWWLCLVDFDASSFSKGSYLNVAAMWLWDDDRPFFHYATGGRIAEFVAFESEEQFAPEAQRLADLAAQEVKRYRASFPDLRSAAEFFQARQGGGNPHRDAAHAGIAWGMLGEMVTAREAFARSHQIIEGYWREQVAQVSGRSDEERARARQAGVHFYTRSELASARPKLNEEHARVARFEILLSEPELFRAEVLNAIAAVRAGLKLPPADADMR